MTSKSATGEGPDVKSKDPDYVGDIDLLLATFKAWKSAGNGASSIPKSGGLGRILYETGKHQWQVGKKWYDVADESGVIPVHSPGSASYIPSEETTATVCQEWENGCEHVKASRDQIMSGDTVGGGKANECIFKNGKI